VGFVVENVAVGQVFLPVLLFPLSVRLHQCPELLLSEGQAGEGWEFSKQKRRNNAPPEDDPRGLKHVGAKYNDIKYRL
jgi:hypothetical protein